MTKRLDAIASLITTKKVYDIGSDHGYLDIYLSQNHEVTATDISPSSINKIKKNMKKSNTSFDVVLTDGLNGLSIDKLSTIIIAGMGAHTIINILKNNVESLSNEIVIQSNNNLYDIRKYITSLGYYIKKEIIIYENKRFYVITKYIKGYKKYSDFELLVGTCKYNKEYIKYLLNVYNKIYNQLPFKYLIKKIKVRIIINKLKGYVRTNN